MPLFFYSHSGLFIDGQSSQPYCISLETRAIVSQTRRRTLYQQDESVKCVTVNKLFEVHMSRNRIESYRIENVTDVHAPHRERDMNKLNNMAAGPLPEMNQMILHATSKNTVFPSFSWINRILKRAFLSVSKEPEGIRSSTTGPANC